MIKFTELDKPFDLLQKAHTLAKLHRTEINYELDRQAREQSFSSWDDLVQNLSEVDRETVQLTCEATGYDEKEGFFLKPDSDLLGKVADALAHDNSEENSGKSVRLIKTILRMNLETSSMKLDCSAEELARFLHITTSSILIEFMEAENPKRLPEPLKFITVAQSFSSEVGDHRSARLIHSLLTCGLNFSGQMEFQPHSDMRDDIDGEKLAVFVQLALRMFATEDLKMAA
ncbi:MAG: hypothetical protein CL949_20435 [Erythrobacter sp.]|nr:hypothetical protein [Erythrobacter sp.]